MSKSARIVLVDEKGNENSKEDLLNHIAAIRSWDNGHNYPIEVQVETLYIMDSIDSVEIGINSGIKEYIQRMFTDASKLYDNSWDDDSVGDMIVDYANERIEEMLGSYALSSLNGVSNQKKVRKKATNFSAPKKKRK